MRVLFNTYPHAFQNPGGGEKIILKLSEYLKKNHNCQVELFNLWEHNFDDFDVIHEFSLKQWELWRAYNCANIPMVLTPTTWPENSIASRLKFNLKQNIKETALKTDTPRKFLRSIPKMIFPTTNMEKQRIMDHYGIEANKFTVVPNATDIFSKEISGRPFQDQYKIKDYILFVGRISSIKNLLTLINACNDLNQNLIIIGSSDIDSKDYEEKCREQAGANIHFIGPLGSDSPELIDAYRGALSVCIPSYFETCSLVGLEAASLGTPIIITERGATREVYKDHVTYISPESIDSIKIAIKLSLKKNGFDRELQDYIQANYSWNRVAKIIFDNYKKIIQLSKKS